MSWLLKFKKSRKAKEFEDKVDKILETLSTERNDTGQGTSEEKRECITIYYSDSYASEDSENPENNLVNFAKVLEEMRLKKNEEDEEQMNARMEEAKAEMERIMERMMEGASVSKDPVSEDLEFERKLEVLKRNHEERLLKIRVEREKLEKKSDAEHADLLKKLQSQSKSFYCLGVSMKACSESDSGASKRPEIPEVAVEVEVKDSEDTTEDTSEDESETVSSLDWEHLLELIRSDSDDDDSDDSGDMSDSDDSDSSNESSDSESSDGLEEEPEVPLEEVAPYPSPSPDQTFQSSLEEIVSNVKKCKVPVEKELDDNQNSNEDPFVKSMQDCIQEEEEFLEGFRRAYNKNESI